MISFTLPSIDIITQACIRIALTELNTCTADLQIIDNNAIDR